jgi:hypothetical protein
MAGFEVKRNESKSSKVQKYWGGKPVKIDYSQMDQSIIKEFKGHIQKLLKIGFQKILGYIKQIQI